MSLNIVSSNWSIGHRAQVILFTGPFDCTQSIVNETKSRLRLRERNNRNEGNWLGEKQGITRYAEERWGRWPGRKENEERQTDGQTDGGGKRKGSWLYSSDCSFVFAQVDDSLTRCNSSSWLLCRRSIGQQKLCRRTRNSAQLSFFPFRGQYRWNWTRGHACSSRALAVISIERQLASILRTKWTQIPQTAFVIFCSVPQFSYFFDTLLQLDFIIPRRHVRATKSNEFSTRPSVKIAGMKFLYIHTYPEIKLHALPASKATRSSLFAKLK